MYEGSFRSAQEAQSRAFYLKPNVNKDRKSHCDDRYAAEHGTWLQEYIFEFTRDSVSYVLGSFRFSFICLKSYNKVSIIPKKKIKL